jgi:hypothetical protein
MAFRLPRRRIRLRPADFRIGPSAAHSRFGDIYACQALLSLGSLPNLSLARFVRGKAEPSSGNGSEDTGPDQARHPVVRTGEAVPVESMGLQSQGQVLSWHRRSAQGHSRREDGVGSHRLGRSHMIETLQALNAPLQRRRSFAAPASRPEKGRLYFKRTLTASATTATEDPTAWETDPLRHDLVHVNHPAPGVCLHNSAIGIREQQPKAR